MCTVTIIEQPSRGIRLVTNRDESRTRPAASPPDVRVIDGLRILCPRDAKAGGTWVAVNDRGLAMTILNFNERPAREITPGRHSRGDVVLKAAGAISVNDAMVRISGLALDAFAPFRLVVAAGGELAEGRWNRRAFEVIHHNLSDGVNGAPGTACFTSSGLGDALVQRRLELWRHWSTEQSVSPDRQDDFHRHQWADHPELSVRMARPDARTVSTTSIDVRPADAIEMRYAADEVRKAVRLALRETAAVGVPLAEVAV